MSKEDLILFEKGKSGNPNGRPKGSKNRSTIIKELLAQEDNEHKIHQAQINKAKEGDTSAYKAVLDSAYGMPTQQVDLDANVRSEDVTPIMWTKTDQDKEDDKTE
jgi:hypothetical protein